MIRCTLMAAIRPSPDVAAALVFDVWSCRSACALIAALRAVLRIWIEREGHVDLS